MPIFSSDSEDEVAPSSRFSTDKESVHTLLGGGRVADVLLWRDKKMASAIMAVVTILWFLFEVMEYNFITLLLHIFITTMLIIFIWHTAPYLFQGSTISLHTFLVYLAWYQNLKLFAMAVFSLWLLEMIGNYIGTLNLLLLGTLSLETLPFLYDRYEKEVDYFAGKVYRKMGKIYKKLVSIVLDKIPRWPVNGKKANS